MVARGWPTPEITLGREEHFPDLCSGFSKVSGIRGVPILISWSGSFHYSPGVWSLRILKEQNLMKKETSENSTTTLPSQQGSRAQAQYINVWYIYFYENLNIVVKWKSHY